MRTKLPVLGLVTAIALVGAMAIGAPSFAGSGEPAKDTGPLSVTPWKTFSTAAQGGTSVVVSTNGNVLSFTSPTGSQHIAREGYVICYEPIPNTVLNAYDLAATETRFLPSTQGTSNVLRSTSDGVLSLNQAFAFSAANRQLTIAMTVKNLTGSTVYHVVLRRQVDFDIPTGDYADDWHAATVDSYFAWDSHGMVLRHISVPSGVSHGAVVDDLGYQSWCSPVGVSNPVQGDYAGTVAYNIGNLAPGKSKTMKVAYLRY
jgi:hypothetical protein